jgi:hypothetical protein
VIYRVQGLFSRAFHNADLLDESGFISAGCSVTRSEFHYGAHEPSFDAKWPRQLAATGDTRTNDSWTSYAESDSSKTNDDSNKIGINGDSVGKQYDPGNWHGFNQQA